MGTCPPKTPLSEGIKMDLKHDPHPMPLKISYDHTFGSLKLKQFQAKMF